MRVKRGVTKQKRHAKILKLASGYRMSYHKLYRRAKEAVLHAGQYSYAHRRRRRSQVRQEWNKVIAAALTSHKMNYSKFIHGLKVKNISIDRKNLSELAISYPQHFAELVKQAGN
jgi:large subunit ribosomal protein L20